MTDHGNECPDQTRDLEEAGTCDSGPVVRWLVASTHRHREGFALENLQRQNFACYCPMVSREIRHARRKQTVLRPLFPGYVFVQICEDLTGLRLLHSTYGVRSVVRCGDKPSFIDSGFIDALRAREVDGAIVHPSSLYHVGQRVYMNGGPFDGLVATIIEMQEKERLVVLLDLLQQSVRVRLPAEKVRPD